MNDNMIYFLVVGRLGKSLTLSKLEPLLTSSAIAKVYVFRETTGFPMDKTQYVTLPGWILNIKPAIVSKFIRLLAEPLQLLYWSWKVKPDIINGYHIIPKGLNSFFAARLSGSKCIVSMIGGTIELDTYKKPKFFWKNLNLFVLRKSDLITTKGSVVKDYLMQHGINGDKIMIFNGSVNLRKFFFDPSVPKDIDVLFVGTFRNLKGPDRVLRMLAILKENFPFIKACFIGQGYLFESCLTLAKSLGISENVSFAGQVDEPAGYFQQSKVLVLPSRSEGLPTSMLEAMACGCVPVVSNVGNIREAARHGNNAFLIDDYMDVDSFTRYIHTLLSDENLRAGMAQQGVLTVKNNYSALQQGKIVDQIIYKLFADHGTN